MRSLLPPRLSGLAAAQGTETGFSRVAPLGAEGEVDPVGFGGRGVRVLRPAFPLPGALSPAEAQAPGSGSRPWGSCSAENESRGSKSPFKN